MAREDELFTDVDQKDLPERMESEQFGRKIEEFWSLRVGAGASTVRADISGLWAGAETFAAAPFSVDMDGNLSASSVTITGGSISGVTVSGFLATTGGTMTGDLTLNGGNIVMSGSETVDGVDVSNLNTSYTNHAADSTIHFSQIGGLSDVTEDAVSNGEIFYYETNHWENKTLAEAGISATGHTHTESDITDLGSYLENVVEYTTPQLGGELDSQGNSIIDLADVTFKTGTVGGTLRTGTSNADKFELQAYDVNDTTYRKVLEVDAGNEPQLEVFADSFAVWDNTDETKQLFFTLSGGSTGVTTEIIHSPTSNRQITFPDNTGTVALTSDVVTDHTNLTNIGTNTHAQIDNHIADGTLHSVDGWISYSAVTPTRDSADDPTYVLTFAGVDLTSTLYPGMRIKWTQNSTVRYAIITKMSFSTDTTMTVYGGTDYDVEDTGTHTISDFYYSTHKAPAGFPLDPGKWTEETTDTSSVSQSSPAAATWYNLGSITIDVPIGAWLLYYRVSGRVENSTNPADLLVTLSTANNTESDAEMTGRNFVVGATGLASNFFQQKNITLASKDTYYLNAQTRAASANNIYFRGNRGTTVIRAVCAYL